MIIQILAIVFALFAISRTYLRLREGKLKVSQFVFWVVLWLGVVVLAFIPQTASYVSVYLGISRPIDAVIYGSIVLLFYLIFRLYVMLSDIEKTITQLVTDLALRKKK
ncbi:MAG: DUF2304 domain-containing protein [Candidatus Nanoarchaeia archaeon]